MLFQKLLDVNFRDPVSDHWRNAAVQWGAGNLSACSHKLTPVETDSRQTQRRKADRPLQTGRGNRGQRVALFLIWGGC